MYLKIVMFVDVAFPLLSNSSTNFACSERERERVVLEVPNKFEFSFQKTSLDLCKNLIKNIFLVGSRSLLIEDFSLFPFPG